MPPLVYRHPSNHIVGYSVYSRYYLRDDCKGGIEIFFERKEPMNRNGKILIMVDKKDPNKVIARNLVTGKQAEAKCNPADKFDFDTGAKLAFERLMDPQKQPYWNGKVVCVDGRAHTRYFTIGKVYRVIDGRLLDNNNNFHNPYTTHIKSIDDLNKRAERYWEFVEYKGGAEE